MSSSHIISKFNWDTSFDAKDKAVELQDRLSQWSRLMMPGEIMEVFDRICPPDQTWRIQTLELDLGRIEYENLETDLAMKLREQLLQKLVELIIYMNKNSDNIEILDEDLSQVNMLSAFLMNGIMPWNYKPEYGSVNQMLSQQLQYHRQEVIQMLRETGSTHENVRKRMAWQFNEPNILKIIEGLEPNHHGQIIEFSTELTRIQTTQLIVQTSARDFKKNLWHWIFNHLLTERGTIFNKVAFMKSSIRQMAGHYNISYQELVRLIEEVVNRLPEYYSVKSDFILALKVLANDRYQDLQVVGQTQNEATFFWESLGMFFADHTARKRKDGRARFNELVYALSMEDRERFGQMVFALPKTETYWTKVLDDLNELSIENIFHALLPTGGSAMLEALKLVQEVMGKKNSHAAKKQTLYSGISFLYDHRDQPFDHKCFFRYCLAELNKKDPSAGIQIFRQLNGAEIPVQHKGVSAAELYLDLTTVVYNELSKTGQAFSVQYIHTLLEEVEVETGVVANAGTIAGHLKQPVVSLPAAMAQWVRFNPRQTFEALQGYADKEKLKQLLPAFLDAGMASVLARSAKNTACTLVLTLQSFCRKLAQKVTGIPEKIADEILVQGITTVLLHSPQQLPAEKFLEEMLGKIFAAISPSKYQELLQFTAQLSARKIHGFPGLSPELLATIQERFERSARVPLLQKVEILLEAKANAQSEIGGLLLEHFDDHVFVRTRKIKDEKSKILLNKMLPGGADWMTKLVGEYTLLLAPELKQLSAQKRQQLLEEIYWKCILDHRHHRGQVAVFQRQYRAALVLRFPAQKKLLVRKKISSGLLATEVNIGWAMGEKNRTGPTAIHWKNEKEWTQEELFFCLQKGLTDAVSSITVAGKTIALRLVVLAALERDPAMVRKMMAELPATPKRIENLSAVISFDEFSAWVCSDMYGTVQKSMEALRLLSAVVVHFDQGPVHEEWQAIFFKQAWNFVRTQKMNAATLRTLVRNAFTALQIRSGINVQALSAEIRKRDLDLNEALFAAIRHEMPTLKIMGKSTKNKTNQKTMQFAQTGLLDELCIYLLHQKQVPPWYENTSEQGPEKLLQQLMEEHPARVLAVLKREVPSETQYHWLHQSIGFTTLAAAIVHLDKNRQPALRILEKFYAAFTGITLDCVSTREVQCILFEKLLRSWTTGNQKLVSVEQVWHELTWEICVKRRVSRQALLKEMGQLKFSWPPAIQVGFERLLQETKEAKKPVLKNILPVATLKLMDKKAESVQQQQKSGVAVRNAGLVLLNTYVPQLFKRVGLLEEKTFRDPKAQHDAVHYLQYLVTGQQQTEESLLLLNKVMCGLPLAQPLEDGIEIPVAHQELMNGLVKAAIGYWPSIGNTSVDGFRGNWLVRNGLLLEQEDRWELVVEKRAYDVLMNKSPFSFSIIRYPWMNKPLHVSWPY